MNSVSRSATRLAAIAIALAPGLAWATNGMDLEGYGPIALGMGGAAMAYDNGTAAMMNNPATLGLMPEGDRLDLAVGMLGPDVKATAHTPGGDLTAKSSATAFYMPAAGWVRKRGAYTYGLGIYGQGGMGTQYSENSWMADPGGIGAHLRNRTELSVGRVIAPLAFQPNEHWSVAGSLDLVWAGMDLQMALSQAQFVDLVTTQQAGTASGSLVTAFGGLYEPFGGTGVKQLNDAYFNFTNGSPYTGKARALGYAGKLGVVYRPNPRLAIGATYHSRTRLSDMETDAATLSMAVNANFGGGYQNYDIPVTGKVKIRDFQWPATYAIGAAFQATDRLLLVMDVKHIDWASTMKNFSMTFQADTVQANPLAAGFAGKELDTTLYQDWKNQNVVSLGAAYQATSHLTLRVGLNRADNPVPDRYLNALFPAIETNHVTAGFGYRFNPRHGIDFAVSRASQVSATNPGNGSTVPPVTSTHSQLSWQFLYSYYF